MSFLRTQVADIKDLVCLEKAATHRQLKFDRLATHFKSYDRANNKCSGKLYMEGSSYEVGLIENKKTGTYDFSYDEYGATELAKAMGPHANKLRDEYNAQVAMSTLARQGMRAQRTVKADGSIMVVANG